MEMRFKTFSDIASVRVYNDSVEMFFTGSGSDGEQVAVISDSAPSGTHRMQGMFTLKEPAYLAKWDVEDVKDMGGELYEFTAGRWFVYNVYGMCWFQRITE